MAWAGILDSAVSGKRGLFIVNIRYNMMTKALVGILDHLLRVNGQPGALISIERPHIFVSKLMEKHGIPTDKLVYLDAVTNISGEPGVASESLDLLASPFCVNFMSGFTTCHAAKVAVSSRGFILMDNLAALAPYMSEACIDRFVGLLKSLDTECIIVLDKDKHRSLFDILMNNGATELTMTDNAICI
jgi:hypothetical protein